MKTKKETINISSKWENQLPLYLDLYSKLNNEGKKRNATTINFIR